MRPQVLARTGREIAFEVPLDDEPPFTVWLRSDDTPLELTGAAVVAAVLVPCMARSVPIDAPLPLDRRFRSGLHRIQAILATWYPELTPVPVEAPDSGPEPAPTATGCFFTGGVDSFHVALTRRDEVDQLVFVHGFDVPLAGAPRLAAAVTERLDRAAADLGRPLVRVVTNLHEYSDAARARWGTHYHGAALATVAHGLGAGLGRLLVGATHSYTDQFPWGSHPLLDPHWSSAGLGLEHVGAEADRVDKVAVLADSPPAMAHLRVCWQNPDQAYNCGRCPKCVRTMVALRTVGALDRCATLPHEVDLDAVEALPIPNRNILARQAELIAHLRRRGDDPELLAACEANLRAVGPSGIDWGTGWTAVIPDLSEGGR